MLFSLSYRTIYPLNTWCSALRRKSAALVKHISEFNIGLGIMSNRRYQQSTLKRKSGSHFQDPWRGYFRHWTLSHFSEPTLTFKPNQCRPTPTLRIASPTLDTPLSPTLDALIAKSTPDITQNFESTPDTPTPLHGPYFHVHRMAAFRLWSHVTLWPPKF